MLEMRKLKGSGNNYYAAYTVNGRLMEPLIGKKSDVLTALASSDADDVEHIVITDNVEVDANETRASRCYFHTY
jgi:hypothetical protein